MLLVDLVDLLLVLQNVDGAILGPNQVVLLIHVPFVGGQDADKVQNAFHQDSKGQEDLEDGFLLLLALGETVGVQGVELRGTEAKPYKYKDVKLYSEPVEVVG